MRRDKVRHSTAGANPARQLSLQPVAVGASSALHVVSVVVSGSTVTVTPVSEGAATATVTVTATDPGGSNGTATQTFTVAVGPAANQPPEPVGALPPLTIGVDEAAVPVDVASAFRDPDGDLLTYTATSSALDVVSVRTTGDRGTLTAVGVGTTTIDPVLRAGVTRVRLAHLLELREALAAMYRAAGRAEPHWTDPALSVGMTPIRAAHLTELRAALFC